VISTAEAYVIRTDDGGWRVAGTRVSLDSVIRAHLEGLSAEATVESFPTLSPEQIHGAIAFYLRNRAEIDQYLAAQDERWEALRRESEARSGPLLARLRAANTRVSNRLPDTCRGVTGDPLR
jgi:uncharacterized protein (DUF433 family)